MELRARIDFSGSVRFDVRGEDTAAVAEEAAARGAPSVSFFCLRERTAVLSAYQGRCASSITAGSSSRISGRTGKKRMADSAEPAGGFSAFRAAVSI